MDDRPPPRLDDPAERIAYMRELRQVARFWRYGGLALLVAALVLGAGGYAPSPVQVALILVGTALLIVGIFKRTRYHRQRMRRS